MLTYKFYKEINVKKTDLLFMFIFAMIKLIFWHIWDFVIRNIWFFLPSFIKNFLRNFIKSDVKIKNYIYACLAKYQGIIIQVGSCDGITNDNLYDAILKYKRQTFLIEPLSFLAEKLRLLHEKNTYVKIFQFAIHPNLGSIDFFCFPRDGEIKMGPLWRPWYHQIGSTKKQHVEKFAPIAKSFIEKITISCKTLNQVITENCVKSISILSIDCEGFDIQVLNSLDIERVKPQMIILEHMHLDIFSIFSLINKMYKLDYKVKVYHDDVIFYLGL